MTSEKQALVTYRLERARQSLEEAMLLLEAGHANAYVNRLYYACFYAVSALLLIWAANEGNLPFGAQILRLRLRTTESIRRTNVPQSV
jgi:hypothetical protein